MSRTAFSMLLLSILMVSCLPGLPLSAAAAPPAAQPIPPTATGASASRLGAAALMIEERPGENVFSIVPVSAETGKPIEGAQPVTLGGAIAYGFSKDRSQMAFLSNRSEGCLTYCLRVMDLRKWEELGVPTPVEKSLSAWFTVPVFDQNSDILPLILTEQTDTVGEVLLVDRSQGKVAARASLRANIFGAAYTPEGALAVHGLQTNRSGAGPVVYLALLDSADLHILWEKTLPEIHLSVDGGGDHNDPAQGRYYDPATAFSPDGSKLYFVAADKPLFVTVDFQSQRISAAEIQPRRSLLERLLFSTASVAHAKIINGVSMAGVLSQDGRYFYVAGEEHNVLKGKNGQMNTRRIPLGLRVIDTQDGTLVQRVETDATRPSLAPDGKTLLLMGWDDKKGYWTDVVEIASWKVVQRLEGVGHPTRLLDGSQAWMVVEENDRHASIIDLYRPGDTTPRSQIIRDGYVDWVLIP